jgi:uncharacterized protein
MIQKYEFLLTPLLSWMLAQGVKFVLTLRKDGLQIRDLYASGGFPSSHASLTVSLATIIGLRLGFSSAAFAIAASFAGVVMYDAMGVRRTTGQQTSALKELSHHTNHKLKTAIGRAKGHTPLEVIGGITCGILVALTVYAIDVNYTH